MRFMIATAASASSACSDSTSPRPDELFTRYVAVGASTAAGVQASGISAATQQQAYPVALAELAGAAVNVPQIAGAGCPEPVATPLAAPVPIEPCELTGSMFPARSARNLAVPGTRSADAVVLNNSLVHQTLFLGGQTQLQAALAADPTFLTVHIGDDDVLEAAARGILGPIAPRTDSTLTTLASFNARYGELIAALADEESIQEAVLIGVVDPTRFHPLLQPGAFYFLARDVTGRFQGKLVNASCSPINQLGQPNPLSNNLVSHLILADASVTEINCDPAASGVASPYVLSTTEVQIIRARVDAFNASIATLAAAHGWQYLDVNTMLEPYLAEANSQGQRQRIRMCQRLPGSSTAPQFQTAVLTSCPVTGSTSAPNHFGSLLTFDGVNFSAEYHALLATAIFGLISAPE